MCGIFGVIGDTKTLKEDHVNNILKLLAIMAESRGKEASGIATLRSGQIDVYREPVTVSKLINTKRYKNLVSALYSDPDRNSRFVVMGHSRLVTNGTQEENKNNQPVVKDGIVGIHNGIITNSEDLWLRYSEFNRQTEIDTEILFALIRHYLTSTKSFSSTIEEINNIIEGTYSIALMFEDLNKVFLSTNNGSLYCAINNNNIIFASEKIMLTKYIKESKYTDYKIRHVDSNQMLAVDLETLEIVFGSLKKGIVRKIYSTESAPNEKFRDIVEHEAVLNPEHLFSMKRIKPLDSVPKEFDAHVEQVRDAVEGLQRCTKCLLPSTFPYIEFDENGICLMCNNHTPFSYYGSEKLHAIADAHRKDSSEPDCVIAFSGGRDSSYLLHYAVKELGLTPLAYTYDWGVVTDLARRNIYRLCGKLGVEHILISADINKKRNNIKNNVSAWLEKPHLGIIPLFMAGDKMFISNALNVSKAYNIPLVMFGNNQYEHTGFKSGFAGVDQGYNPYYAVSKMKKLRLLSYYVGQFIKQPKYLNTSVMDTLHAFYSAYIVKRSYLQLFKYIVWDEKEIQEILNREYDWEIAHDTSNTWRIGDGTAAFYNYIYYMIAGFTENETFVSNQIREGVVTREEGYKKVLKSNEPRYETIKWYCDIVGLDFYAVIDRVNKIPKLYPFLV